MPLYKNYIGGIEGDFLMVDDLHDVTCAMMEMQVKRLDAPYLDHGVAHPKVVILPLDAIEDIVVNVCNTNGFGVS